MYRKLSTAIISTFVVSVMLFTAAFAQEASTREAVAPGHPEWCVYFTTGSVKQIADDSDEMALAISRMRDLGVTKAYLEVYRGEVVPPETLIAARDALRAEGFAVAAGIATVPGGGYGVRQEGPLDWFNWQNPKTQHDMREVTTMAAGIFDEFIVDDFYCTGDVSEESHQAKGDRSWSDYRRDLLVKLASSIFIEPAKAVNPDITMVIKYPQWYDKFHEHGYDVARESPLFDKVWVGTETRGANTQRFGFTQAYMGFVNYRWIASVAGDKMSGAWFDHGDCDAIDFVDQAYQSVLAGAPAIMIFSYGAVRGGHPGHPLLVEAQPQLKQLADAVAQHPVVGVAALKPPNSPAGSDMFIMDTIGMLGVPLVPVSAWPENAEVVFLPTQAAAEPSLAAQVQSALEAGKTIVMTPGLLAASADAEALAQLAGVSAPVSAEALSAATVSVDGEAFPLYRPLDLGSSLELAGAEAMLTAEVDGQEVPLLTRREIDKARVFVLNIRTYSQADYDAVDEVLLPPHPLGLLELPRPVVNALRAAFNAPLGIAFDAVPRITLQTLADGSAVVQNYHDTEQEVALTIADPAALSDTWKIVEPKVEGDTAQWTMAPRSRAWLNRVR
ncbi:MAG: hypothetical protein AMXMBFR82_32960 [Candidatus Hydrogenedentota bacterium]